MIRKIFIVSPWVSLTFVAAATLGPVAARPHLFDAHVEHFGAYVVIGLLFGLVYPRQTFLICVIVLGAAALLESLQLLTPDRHGQVLDLAAKLAGGTAGIVAGKIAARQIALRRR
jgi:VanZ family protein